MRRQDRNRQRDRMTQYTGGTGEKSVKKQEEPVEVPNGRSISGYGITLAYSEDDDAYALTAAGFDEVVFDKEHLANCLLGIGVDFNRWLTMPYDKAFNKIMELVDDNVNLAVMMDAGRTDVLKEFTLYIRSYPDFDLTRKRVGIYKELHRFDQFVKARRRKEYLNEKLAGQSSIKLENLGMSSYEDSLTLYEDGPKRFALLNDGTFDMVIGYKHDDGTEYRSVSGGPVEVVQLYEMPPVNQGRITRDEPF